MLQEFQGPTDGHEYNRSVQAPKVSKGLEDRINGSLAVGT